MIRESLAPLVQPLGIRIANHHRHLQVVDRPPRKFLVDEIEQSRPDPTSSELWSHRQRVKLCVALADGERVIGAILDAHERVSDDVVAFDRHDQESVPGTESVQVQRAATLPGQLVVLDQRQRPDRQAVVMMYGQPQRAEIVHSLGAGQFESRQAGLWVNPRVR